ncbi:MAG: ParB/RepB/Spo0J family partition protein [bacterium]|nr:ParB/RepB/Spo0J family partition protein [bacterium]
MSKHGLGKGLSALLPDNSTESSQEKAGVAELPLDKIIFNPLQPRKKFAEEALKDLAESIKVHGVVQPVIVTKVPQGYRLVVGERRTRAAKLAGLTAIPAIVRELSDQHILEIALIENIQREDLNPIEEAQAFSHLISEHGLTQEQLSERLGRSRPAVTNSLRLLKLPDEIRKDLESGVLKAGHARAIMGLDDKTMLMAWKRIREEDMSVRQAEKLAAALKAGQAVSAKPKHAPPALSADWDELLAQLRSHLNADVRIAPKANGKGRLEFHYSNQDELERLIELFVYLGERESSRY